MFEARKIVSLLKKYKDREEFSYEEILKNSFNGVPEKEFVFWAYRKLHPKSIDKKETSYELTEIIESIDASIDDHYLERTSDGNLKIISSGHRIIQNKYFYMEFLPKTFGYFGSYVIGFITSTLFLEIVKFIFHLIEKI